MDLSTYNFAKIEEYSFMSIPEELLIEAKSRKLNKGVEKFNDLFFNGGKYNYSKDVIGTWKEDAINWAFKLMRSWLPKHEHKEIVCAMIFEECLEL